MPFLYFDTVMLHGNGLRAGGQDHPFAQFGGGSTVSVFARQLTVESVPDRHLNLATDRLIVTRADAFASVKLGRKVRIAAERIEGPVNIACPGGAGTAGTPGTPGKPARVIMVVADSRDPDIREPKLISGPTAGGPGGNGGQGKPGGLVQLWYVTTQQGPVVSALGGPGGARGPGGKGGAGHPDVHPANGANGANGQPGPPGPNGTAQAQLFSSAAQMWDRWAREMAPDEVPFAWATYRLRVAEHLFRSGQPGDLAAAREHLDVLVTRPNVAPIIGRVRVLLQRLFEHVTFCGMPRDLDVTPDVDFVGQDNDQLLDVALELIGNAETVASATEMQKSFAAFVRLGAAQSANTLNAAAKRTARAQESLKTAISGTDIARGRVKNMDKKISELQQVISDEQDANSGPFALMKQIVELGVAVGQVAVGVSTGVGAVIAVGRGFATLQKTANSATGLFDLVGDVQKELKSGSLKKFKTGLKDLNDAGKSIYDLGKLVSELDGITSTHPDPKVRELAEVQRERVLLHQEVALNTQMEKEAQLGIDAAKAEEQAITQNIGLSNTVAAELEQQGDPAARRVLEPLLASVRQLLDALSVRVFLTLRAREVYLGLDPVQVVRHDLGQIHPDREQMLTLGERVDAIRQDVAGRALQIIEWSSLVDDMAGTGDLSRGPIPFFFSTENPQLLDPLRATGRLGFYVPVEDLFEEDGSQLFEVKFDGATIMLHGARIPNGSGQAIKLRQLGRWSVRRRPDSTAPNGTVKDFALPGREVFLTCRAMPGGIEAHLPAPSNPRSQPPFSLWGRGIAGDWELTDVGGIDFSGVTKVEIGFASQALSRTGFALRAVDVRRLLHPLPGWPVPAPLPRPATPVPPRGGGTSYGYRYGVGSVAAVGAALV